MDDMNPTLPPVAQVSDLRNVPLPPNRHTVAQVSDLPAQRLAAAYE